MSEDRTNNDPGDKSWIEKIAHAFSSEPKTRDDLMAVVKIARQNEVIDDEVYSIIEGATEVADMQVREVMIPRNQMVVVKSENNIEKSLKQIIESGHSRFPVIGESLDEIQGIMLAKDLLPLALKKRIDLVNIKKLIRQAKKVPESKRLNVLLKEFREQKHHMAVVIDEYGSVAGLITIEDVLEEIVGEIEDEYDEETDPFIKKLSTNDYMIKSLTPIDDFNDMFHCELSDKDYDTIGGLLMQTFGHVPKRNETANIDKFHFKVLNADNRRVHLLRMSVESKTAIQENN